MIILAELVTLASDRKSQSFILWFHVTLTTLKFPGLVDVLIISAMICKDIGIITLPFLLNI